MELPPGSRGYGTDNIVPHPDTATLQDKVGIFRNGPDLEAAVTELKALLQRSRHIKVSRTTECKEEGLP
ncbi:hypothetical protein TI05_18360 [Achromatium sp. WMS3]|nr:hypothetical protein TI05_18360 [Achromatium sp. WMS3]